MRVLFLLIQHNAFSLATWHQGLASIITVLRQSGHRADLLEVKNLDPVEIEAAVKAYKADVVAATATSNDFVHVRGILSFLKNRLPHIFTILGGVHITTTLGHGSGLKGIADAVCLGEGEIPMLELVDGLSRGKKPQNIPNIYNPEDDVRDPIQTYYVRDLDSLPIPDRDIFEIYRKADRTGPLPFTVRFLWCRGCPFNCSYCCNKTMKQHFPERKNYVRRLSVDRAIEELCSVADQFKFDRYVIDDDIFTIDRKWFEEFCGKYPDWMAASKKFTINIRVGNVDRDMLKNLKELGCELVEFGLESGSEDIRFRVLNRKMTNEMIEETASMCREAGLKFQTFNMLGIPGEGRKDVWETIKLNRRIQPDELQVTVFYPFPNTDLGRFCIEKGMLREDFRDSYFGRTILRHDKLTKTEIELYEIFFKLLVFIRYSPKKATYEFLLLLRRTEGFTWIRKLMPASVKKMILQLSRPS